MPQREPRWLEIARADIGVKETPGPKSNPTVLAYFADVGRPDIKDDATAWCAAGLGSWLKRAGLRIPAPKDALAAISYEKWGVPTNEPRLGAIVVIRRPGEAWMRHTGILVAANPTFVWLVSANASDRVGIDAFRRERVTAMRWPEGVPMTGLALPTTAAGALSGSEA